MSSSIRSNFVNLVIFAGVVGLAVSLFFGIKAILATDSLAHLRPKDDSFNLKEGIVMNDFTVTSYRKEKLVASMQVSEATVLNDRSLLLCRGISDGRLYSDSDKVYQFEAANATYANFSKAITAEGGIHLWGDDLDLTADGFNYDHESKTVHVHGSVKGMLNGGKLLTEKVVINLGTEELSGGKFTWSGEILLAQNSTPQKKSNWNLEGESYKIKSGIHSAVNAKGWDDDTLVKAKSIIFDRNKDFITAEGNVEYFGKEANITCEKATIDRKTSHSILESKKRVTMLIKPEETKPQETEIPAFNPGQNEEGELEPVRQTDNLRQYPVALDAGKIEYWYKEGERKAIVTGAPYARQQLPDNSWRDLTSFRADYDGEKETLKLTSKPGEWGIKIRTSIGDQFESKVATISTQEGDDSLEASPIRGIVVPTDDDSGTGSTGGLSGAIGD